MLLPKQFFETISEQILQNDLSKPKKEIELQIRSLLQTTFNKLDLVTREEFDSQKVVLERTLERLEELELKISELEKSVNINLKNIIDIQD